MGSLHFVPVSLRRIQAEEGLTEASNLIEVNPATDGTDTSTIRHQYFDRQESCTMLVNNKYLVHRAGVVPNLKIVDSTGAGDSFIGAFLLSSLFFPEVENPIQFGLQFGAWVAGRKLEGPGSRTTLPKGTDVDSSLGKDIASVKSSLERIVTPFNGGDSSS